MFRPPWTTFLFFYPSSARSTGPRHPAHAVYPLATSSAHRSLPSPARFYASRQHRVPEVPEAALHARAPARLSLANLTIAAKRFSFSLSLSLRPEWNTVRLLKGTRVQENVRRSRISSQIVAEMQAEFALDAFARVSKPVIRSFTG